MLAGYCSSLLYLLALFRLSLISLNEIVPVFFISYLLLSSVSRYCVIGSIVRKGVEFYEWNINISTEINIMLTSAV